MIRTEDHLRILARLDHVDPAGIECGVDLIAGETLMRAASDLLEFHIASGFDALHISFRRDRRFNPLGAEFPRLVSGLNLRTGGDAAVDRDCFGFVSAGHQIGASGRSANPPVHGIDENATRHGRPIFFLLKNGGCRLELRVVRRLDSNVAVEFQQPGIQPVLQAVRMARCSLLLHSRRLRRSDDAAAMVVDQLFSPKDRLFIKLTFDISIALKIARVLVVRTILAPDVSGRVPFCCAVDGEINVLEHPLVVFKTQARLRSHGEYGFAAFGLRICKTLRMGGNPARQSPPEPRWLRFMRALRQVVPRRNSDKRHHQNWEQHSQ